MPRLPRPFQLHFFLLRMSCMFPPLPHFPHAVSTLPAYFPNFACQSFVRRDIPVSLPRAREWAKGRDGQGQGMWIDMAQRERIRHAVPWWAKGAMKLALAKAPVGYSVLRHAGLAHHGGMESPEYVMRIFGKLFDGVDFGRKAGGFTALELGPGDSMGMALLLSARGAAASSHIDVRPFANRDGTVYQRIAQYIAAHGLTPPDLSHAASLEDVLSACNARYETDGLESLRRVPSESIDFLFSNAVLQAIRRDELEATLRESRRVMRADGVGVHNVDLRDMIGQSLNHLRFSERVWESRWFQSSGFYTNRLRLSELADLCRRCGFEVSLPEITRWDHVPIPRQRLAPPYRDLSDDDLCAATVRMVLRPMADTGSSAASN